ncbi:hypothetical protein BJ138DRAFT_1138370 [Hygrophoropsis aurantiaca]|uniref:Uncharacterized protein n=1 Tax=Hygrophoropsis aurantiaca TaxID=72124 RepID=A0ACB7ZVA4_9AGAM|nr:hypothetical protein BJ138DRAFT_1138370 [Hygrophoropsis aurantiaca]
MVLVEEYITGSGTDATGWICSECYRTLIADTLPKYALANNLWVGAVPHQLAVLTLPEELLISRHFPRCYIVKLHPKASYAANPDHLQRGIIGNVTLYNMNTDAIAGMLEGQLLPQPAATLASVLAVTYVGTKILPKQWLKSTFRVRRRIVYEALIWLKAHNPLYADINISVERLEALPEDDVPDEITSVMRHEKDEEAAKRESAGYVNDDDSEEIIDGEPINE